MAHGNKWIINKIVFKDSNIMPMYSIVIETNTLVWNIIPIEFLWTFNKTHVIYY